MQAISEIKNELLKALDKKQLQNFLDTYSNDERSGVIKLCESAVKKIAAIDLELQRTFAMYEFERENAELGLLDIKPKGNHQTEGTTMRCQALITSKLHTAILQEVNGQQHLYKALS